MEKSSIDSTSYEGFDMNDVFELLQVKVFFLFPMCQNQSVKTQNAKSYILITQNIYRKSRKLFFPPVISIFLHL